MSERPLGSDRRHPGARYRPARFWIRAKTEGL